MEKGKHAGHSVRCIYGLLLLLTRHRFLPVTRLCAVFCRPQSSLNILVGSLSPRARLLANFHSLNGLVQPWAFPSVIYSALYWLFCVVNFHSVFHLMWRLIWFWLICVQLLHLCLSSSLQFTSAIHCIALSILGKSGRFAKSPSVFQLHIAPEMHTFEAVKHKRTPAHDLKLLSESFAKSWQMIAHLWFKTERFASS